MFRHILNKLVFNSSVNKFWLIVVLLNALFGLFMGLDIAKTFAGDMGIICGVITFFFIYVKLDNRLQYSNQMALSRQIRVCAILRIFTQLLPAADMLIGMMSLGISQFLFNQLAVFELFSGFVETVNAGSRIADIKGFLPFYVTTVLHAIFASLIVGIFVFIANIPKLIRKL